MTCTTVPTKSRGGLLIEEAVAILLTSLSEVDVGMRRGPATADEDYAYSMRKHTFVHRTKHRVLPNGKITELEHD